MLFPFQMLAETIRTPRPTPHCRHPYIWFHPPPEYQDIFCQRAGRRAHNSTYSYLTPCMQHMVNIHLTHPELKQIDHILPHKWDIILKNGTFDFLTRFKSTPNYFKMTFSIKLGKTWLGVGESIPDDYRAECLHVYSALCKSLI